ncbi:hypothetical protein Tco_0728040 [Tanacetum coccineum]|uniref:Uncharacterized protein n=1 Tax=Tanacetum coccineum TaxID=301880 RepID=A0ABQ4YK05_9ASTR
MTGNKDHLDDFEECKGGSVTFGGSKGYITGKGRIRHKVLFTETECLVVSPDFKMPDENQILLKVPRQHNIYSFDMKTTSLTKDYACLIAKATSDESKLWHRRLGTDKAKSTRKIVKTGQTRTQERKSTQRAGRMLSSQPPVKTWSTKVKRNQGPMIGRGSNKLWSLEASLVAINTSTLSHTQYIEADEDEELIVVPTAIKHSAAKVRPRKSSVNLKKEKFLTELQNLQTQEKEASYTGISEDTPKILAFRRDLD